MNNFIKDGNFRNIAQVRTSGTGNQSLTSGNGSKQLATFNKSNNATYDAKGRLIGKGNLLLTQVGK